MSSISQMERSSSKTRMLARHPPFGGGSCDLRGSNRLQFGPGEGFRRRSAGRPFSIEPPQPQDESGSLPWLGSSPHLAFMRLHDLVDDRQAEARAAFKARLEGLENLLRLLRSHSSSSIRKTNLPVVSQAFDAYLQSAAVPHGADRVLGDVPENLFNSVAIPDYPRLGNGKPALDSDARIFDGHAVAHEGKRVFQQNHQVGLIEVILLAAGVGEKVGDNSVQALRFASHDIEQVPVFLAHLGYARKHADRTGDGREWIADLVSDGCRQPAHRCQAVLHADFALQTPNLGEVIQCIDVAQQTALRHVQGGYSYANRLAECCLRVETNLRMGL